MGSDKAATLHLTIAATNIEDMKAQCRAIAGEGNLASSSNDDLLAELRQRLATEGLVVKVVPFETSQTVDPAPTTAPKATRGAGKKNADKEPPKATTTAAPKTGNGADPVQSAEQRKAENASDWDDDSGETTTATELTIDDVKNALNAYSAVKGQVTARSVMQEVGGAAKLAEIPPTKYAELITRLRV